MRKLVLVLFSALILPLIFSGFILEKYSKDTLELKASDFFPKRLVTLEYSGGFENSGYSVTIERIEGNKVQVIQKDSGTSVIKIYKLSPESIDLFFTKEYDGEDKDYFKEEPNVEDTILKTPISVGSVWKNFDGKEYSITGKDVRVLTKAGLYSAIEITSKSNAAITKNYYAKNIGLVKSVVTYNDGMQVKSELIKIK